MRQRLGRARWAGRSRGADPSPVRRLTPWLGLRPRKVGSRVPSPPVAPLRGPVEDPQARSSGTHGGGEGLWLRAGGGRWVCGLLFQGRDLRARGSMAACGWRVLWMARLRGPFLLTLRSLPAGALGHGLGILCVSPAVSLPVPRARPPLGLAPWACGRAPACLGRTPTLGQGAQKLESTRRHHVRVPACTRALGV